MTIQPYIGYILKFYKPNKLKLFVSVLCLTICYLTFEIVIAFGSIIESNAQTSLKKYFFNASFIITSPAGIKFDDAGKLVNNQVINDTITTNFKKTFSQAKYKLLWIESSTNVDKNEIGFIVIKKPDARLALVKFCKENNIKIVNSFTVNNNDSAVMYDVNGIGNRFTLFSFENQISAFILGSELATNAGLISRLIAIFSVIFTFYISLLYFQERKDEFSILIIQGYTDKNLKIIFIDCVIQNLISFLMSIAILASILEIVTKNKHDFNAAVSGTLYILPYVPVLIIIQLLLLLNKSISYASNF